MYARTTVDPGYVLGFCGPNTKIIDALNVLFTLYYYPIQEVQALFPKDKNSNKCSNDSSRKQLERLPYRQYLSLLVYLNPSFPFLLKVAHLIDIAESFVPAQADGG